MKPYTSLNDGILKQNAFAVARLIEGRVPTDRLADLQAVFLGTANSHFDEGARSLFTLIMLHMSDEELLAHAQPNKQGTLELPEDRRGETTIRDAEYRATIARAEKARELLPTIPKARIKNEYVRDGDGESINRDCAYPTLPETKKAMLFEVARGWKTARDESESDTFLKFLLTTPLRHDEEEPLRLATFRKITEERFSMPRLVRTIGALQRTRTVDLDIFHVLVQAWTKNANPQDIANVFQIFEPLSGPAPGDEWGHASCSDALAGLMRNAGSEAKSIDDAITTMFRKIGRGEATLDYADAKTANIRVADTIASQKNGFKAFGYWRDKIKEWLAANRNPGSFKVHLWYIGVNESWRPERIMVELDEIL